MSQENNESGEPKSFPFLCVAGGTTVFRETKEQGAPVQEVSRAAAVLNEEVLSLSHQNAQLGQELDRSRKLIRKQTELITDLRAENQKLQTAVDAAKELYGIWEQHGMDSDQFLATLNLSSAKILAAPSGEKTA